MGEKDKTMKTRNWTNINVTVSSTEGRKAGCEDCYSAVGNIRYFSVLSSSLTIETNGCHIKIVSRDTAIFVTVYKRDEKLVSKGGYFDRENCKHRGEVLYSKEYERGETFYLKMEVEETEVKFSLS